MSFIFISYSRKDRFYIRKLKRHLDLQGLPVWFDESLGLGATWNRAIEERLEKCKVFLLVMSPNSRESHWVQCELARAIELRKTIFPVLISGKRWLDVEAVQTTEVSGERLPPSSFFESIRSAMHASSSAKVRSQENPFLRRVEDDCISRIYGVKPHYLKLLESLEEEDWRRADIETTHIMSIAQDGNDAISYLSHEKLNNIPCEQLQLLDDIWRFYSNEKWGFSAQVKKYKKCGCPESDEWHWPYKNTWFASADDTRGWNFCRSVGWADPGSKKLKDYFELESDPTLAPSGQYPYDPIRSVWGNWSFAWYLLKRLKECEWLFET